MGDYGNDDDVLEDMDQQNEWGESVERLLRVTPQTRFATTKRTRNTRVQLDEAATYHAPSHDRQHRHGRGRSPPRDRQDPGTEQVHYISRPKEPAEEPLSTRIKDTLMGKHAKATPLFAVKTAETAGLVGINIFAFHETMDDDGPSGIALFTLFEIAFTCANFLVTFLVSLGAIVINGGAFWAVMMGIVVVTLALHISYMLQTWAKQSLYSHAYQDATVHPLLFVLIFYAFVLVILGYFNTTYGNAFFETFDPSKLDPLIYYNDIFHYYICYMVASVLELLMIRLLLVSLLTQRLPERKLYPHRSSDNGVKLFFMEDANTGQEVDST
jgi:hypothetical protein